MTEPTTRTPFTRWFPPGKPVPSMYREFVADNMDFPPDKETEKGFEIHGAAGTMVKQDTYPMPEDGWVCFHCGERFTTVGTAEDHFGARPLDMAACLIKVGEERGLVMELRRVQAELRGVKDNVCVEDGDDGDAAESGEPAAYGHLDREFYSDNMDFPPNFDNGPNPLGEDY